MKNLQDLKTSEIVLRNKDELYTTSFIIADLYNKLHKNVLRDIRELVKKHDSLGLNFKQQSYQQVMKSGGIINHPFYTITKHGALTIAHRYSSYRLSFEIFEMLMQQFEEKEQNLYKASIILSILRNENKELRDKLDIAESRIRAAETFINDVDRLAVFTIKKLTKRSVTASNSLTAHDGVPMLPQVDHNIRYASERNNVMVEVTRTGMLTNDLAKSVGKTVKGMKNILNYYGVFFSASYGMMYRCHDYMVRRGETVIRTRNGNVVKRQSWYWTKKGVDYVRRVCQEHVASIT